MAGKGKDATTVILDEMSKRRLSELQIDISADSLSSTIRFCIREVHKMRLEDSKSQIA